MYILSTKRNGERYICTHTPLTALKEREKHVHNSHKLMLQLVRLYTVMDIKADFHCKRCKHTSNNTYSKNSRDGGERERHT